MNQNLNRRRVLVLMLPNFHALDFAGPVQSIHEANELGASYKLHYVGTNAEFKSAEGFTISKVESLPVLRPSDWVLVPGPDSKTLQSMQLPDQWLQEADQMGCRISSVCTGAFVLARAGLLDGCECTTHWRLLNELRRMAPLASVIDNRLFVKHKNIITSAGVAAGIDMALSVIEDDCGAGLAAKVAREMVLYLRRDGRSEQQSVLLEYRAHMHPAVHRVQDWIIAHPEQRPTLQELAEIAALSARHLSRIFKAATGTTLKTYTNKVKLEVARNLLSETHLTTEDISERCGFKDPRQLRRLWKRQFGGTIRAVLSQDAAPDPRG